jgi:hypothetical protein
MNQKCKINLVMNRQNVLLLCRLIEAGLLTDQQEIDDEIIAAIPKESSEEFKAINEEILRKSDLTEFYQRLKSL